MRLKLRKVVSTFLWMLLCSSVGMVVFSITFFVLNREKFTAQSYTITKVTERDSCTFDASNEILDLTRGTGGLIVYLETKPCAVCSENAMMEVAQYMQDSLMIPDPVLLFHPIMDIDSATAMGYHKRFGDYFNVVVTREDSVMIKNTWMSEYLGFYGIVTDSLNRVQYAGSLFDPDFLICCKKRFGIRGERVL